MSDNKCLCMTTTGKQCNKNKTQGSNYCIQHKNCQKSIAVTAIPEESMEEKKLFAKKEKKVTPQSTPINRKEKKVTPQSTPMNRKNKKNKQVSVEQLPGGGEAQLEGNSQILQMFRQNEARKKAEEEERKKAEEEERKKRSLLTEEEQELEDEKARQKRAKLIEDEDRELKERESIPLRDMIYIIDKDVLGHGIAYYKDEEIKREEAILTDTDEINRDFKVKDDTNTLVSCEQYRRIKGIEFDQSGPTGPIKIIDKKVGDRSALGSVYITCIGEKCDYITKVMDLLEKQPALIQVGSKSADTLRLNYNTIKNEIMMQINASQSGLSPKIVDVFFCSSFVKQKDDEGKYTNYVRVTSDRPFYLCSEPDGLCKVAFRRFFIIMEKMDITVNTFLLNFKDTSLIENYKSNIKSIGIGLLSELHKIGIIHGDPHVSNFMFNLTEDGKQYFQILVQETTKQGRESVISDIERRGGGRDFFGSFASMKLIDFGKSIDLSQKPGNPEEDNIQFLKSLDSGIN